MATKIYDEKNVCFLFLKGEWQLATESSRQNRQTVFDKQEKGRLTFVTVILSVLFLANSVLGILLPEKMYPSDQLIQAFLPNDYINVFFVPTILAIALFLWRQKKNLLARVFNGAAMLFVLYNAIAYAAALNNPASRIINILCILLAVYGLAINCFAIVKYSATNFPPALQRPFAWQLILLLIGLLFVGRAIFQIMDPAQQAMDKLGINIADLAVCSLWVVSAVLWLCKHRAGFYLAVISYWQGSLLFISLLLFLFVQPILLKTKPNPEAVLTIACMGLLFFIPSILLTRKLDGKTARIG